PIFERSPQKVNDPYYYVSPHRYWKDILNIPPYFTIPKKYLDAKPDYIDLADLKEKIPKQN
ncbi:MAG: hypothetical protein COZ34_01925, partial [Candidatus Pacebacteria bacterium CG_4_10_14_3_um_filter_34_15]